MIRKPIVLFPVNPSLLTSNLKVQCVDRMCIYQEVKGKQLCGFMPSFHCSGKNKKYIYAVATNDVSFRDCAYVLNVLNMC